MNLLAPWSITLTDEEGRLNVQPHILRIHDEACSPSAPLRSQFPLPNEVLDVVLDNVVCDNNESYNDVLSFLLTCKGCNEPGFKKYLYRTVCFAPDLKSIAILKGIADDPARAKLVRAIVYKDAAPRRLEVAESERAGLSYRDREFHRPCQHNRMTDPYLWSTWLEDNSVGWMDKFINLETVCYRPTRSMLPVSVDRAYTKHTPLRETNSLLPTKQVFEEKLCGIDTGNIVLPSFGLAQNYPLRYTCAKSQSRHSMNIFYALLRHIDRRQGQRLWRASINFNTLGFVGFPTGSMVLSHLTTLEYKFDSGDKSNAYSSDSLKMRLAHDTSIMPNTLRCPNLRHLIFSGSSLAENNTLHMSMPQIGLVSGWSQLLCPIWTSSLDTLRLINVKLNRIAVQKLLRLSIRLRLENVVFLENSLDVFTETLENRLLSIEVGGLIVLANTIIGGFDKVWVVGSEMEAAATVREYSQYVRDSSALEKIPYVPSKDLKWYMLLRGPSPLRLDNMWTTSKSLALRNDSW